MRIAPSVKLTEDEERLLARWSRGRSTPQRLVLRSNIILLAASGWENKRIASKLRTRQNTVSLWRSRFLSHRVDGISRDAPEAREETKNLSETGRRDHRPNAPHQA